MINIIIIFFFWDYEPCTVTMLKKEKSFKIMYRIIYTFKLIAFSKNI